MEWTTAREAGQGVIEGTSMNLETSEGVQTMLSQTILSRLNLAHSLGSKAWTLFKRSVSPLHSHVKDPLSSGHPYKIVSFTAC